MTELVTKPMIIDRFVESTKGFVVGVPDSNAAIITGTTDPNTITEHVPSGSTYLRQNIESPMNGMQTHYMKRTEAANGWHEIQAKFVYNVRNYRDPSDPDDTLSFKRAIAAAYGSFNALTTIIVPFGAHMISEPITVPMSICIQGCGNGTTIRNTSTTVGGIFKVGGQNVQFNDLTLQAGYGLLDQDGKPAACIMNANHTSINNCVMEGNLGIYLEGGFALYINETTMNCAVDFDIRPYVYNGISSECYFLHLNKVFIHGNTDDMTKVAFTINSCEELYITDCDFRRGTNDTTASITDCANVFIRGSLFNDLEIVNSTDVQIRDVITPNINLSNVQDLTIIGSHVGTLNIDETCSNYIVQNNFATITDNGFEPKLVSGNLAKTQPFGVAKQSELIRDFGW